jgi:hypothetical protein
VVTVGSDPFGAGEGDPSVGISPAKAADERAQVIIRVITNRFMEVSPLILRMQELLHRVRIEQLPEALASCWKGH